MSALFARLGNWFEDAIWCEGRPNLPQWPFWYVMRACWWAEERLR